MTIRRGAIHLVAAALLAASTPFVSGDSPVWFWFSTCRGPLMAIEVRLDEVTLYKGSFPSCLASRTSSHSQGQASRLEFVFRPERAIVWEGYREEADTTAPNDRIECNVMAGWRHDWVLCQVTSNPYGDLEPSFLDAASFATGGLDETRFAWPGKLSTASAAIVARVTAWFIGQGRIAACVEAVVDLSHSSVN